MRVMLMIILVFFLKILVSQNCPVNCEVMPLPGLVAPPQKCNFDIITYGICDNLNDTTCVFYYRKDFYYFWKYYFGDDVPAVDFSKNMVLFIKRTLYNEQDLAINSIFESSRSLRISTTLPKYFEGPIYTISNKYILVVTELNTKRVKIY